MTTKKPHGFATMSKDRLLEISSMGGKSVPKHKRTFSTDRALATAAGRKGGHSVPSEARIFSKDPKFASQCGRLGGRCISPHQRAYYTDRALASASGKKGGLAPHKARKRALMQPPESAADAPPESV